MNPGQSAQRKAPSTLTWEFRVIGEIKSTTETVERCVKFVQLAIKALAKCVKFVQSKQ